MIATTPTDGRTDEWLSSRDFILEAQYSKSTNSPRLVGLSFCNVTVDWSSRWAWFPLSEWLDGWMSGYYYCLQHPTKHNHPVIWLTDPFSRNKAHVVSPFSLFAFIRSFYCVLWRRVAKTPPRSISNNYSLPEISHPLPLAEHNERDVRL